MRCQAPDQPSMLVEVRLFSSHLCKQTPYSAIRALLAIKSSLGYRMGKPLLRCGAGGCRFERCSYQTRSREKPGNHELFTLSSSKDLYAEQKDSSTQANSLFCRHTNAFACRSSSPWRKHAFHRKEYRLRTSLLHHKSAVAPHYPLTIAVRVNNRISSHSILFVKCDESVRKKRDQASFL